MNVYIPLCILLAFLCLLTRYEQKTSKRVFFISMFVTFVFSALRFEFGPDYFNYLKIYEYGSSGFSLDDFWGSSSEYRVEPVFMLYMHLFPRFAWFIACSSLLWFLSCYLFYKKYIDEKYYWFLILYIFFNLNCILNNYVALRTSMSAISFIPAFYFLQKKKKVLYLVFVVIGALFHTTTIFLAVLVLLNHDKKSVILSNGFLITLGVIALFIVLTGSNFIIDSTVGLLVNEVDEFSRYSSYMKGLSVSSSFNALVFKVLTFIPVLFINKAAAKDNDDNYVLIYKIGILAGLLILILGQNLLTDRFLMILSPVYIAAIIRSLKFNESNYNYIIIFITLFVSVYMLYNIMNSPYATSYHVYRTIFSAPYIP